MKKLVAAGVILMVLSVPAILFLHDSGISLVGHALIIAGAIMIGSGCIVGAIEKRE